MTEPDERSKSLSNRETYNVLTDVVAGPNLRMRDNVVQGIAVVVGLIAGAGIGYLVAWHAAGAVVGGFAGVVAGLLLSGIGLMIYRFVNHLRGRHD